ncbi:MAG TPA: c-type cytochrome domain-containing protein, partial [Pirellulaceae bacterium]|nr:c-type cytochrome domain-containing protein [Pirellulaceae bacterium]
MIRLHLFVVCLTLLSLGSSPLVAQQSAAAEKPVDFARDIQPLLARKCFACHGPDAAEGGLRLNNMESALKAL